MGTVTSADGTTIAFTKSGAGPALVLVDGALQYRAFDPGGAGLAEGLSDHFTVYRYDRRGRGESTDTVPYAVSREVEDIGALIDDAGGQAFVYGVSSGAALAMEAALELPGKVTKLALFEPPYNDDGAARQAWRAYTAELRTLLAGGRRGDAIALFMGLVGAPAEQVETMRGTPVWRTFEAVAPTLAYDHPALLGDEAAVPLGRAARVGVPTLLLSGGDSFPFMHATAAALAEAIPDARHQVLEGQTHEVEAAVLEPVLTAFFREKTV